MEFRLDPDPIRQKDFIRKPGFGSDPKKLIQVRAEEKKTEFGSSHLTGSLNIENPVYESNPTWKQDPDPTLQKQDPDLCI